MGATVSWKMAEEPAAQAALVHISTLECQVFWAHTIDSMAQMTCLLAIAGRAAVPVDHTCNDVAVVLDALEANLRVRAFTGLHLHGSVVGDVAAKLVATGCDMPFDLLVDCLHFAFGQARVGSFLLHCSCEKMRTFRSTEKR